MKDFISEHLVTIITYIFGGGSLVGWILERKKKKTEALSTMQEAYNTFTEDSLRRYEDLRNQVTLLRDELEKVSILLSEERSKNRELEDRYATLEREHAKIKHRLSKEPNS